MALIPSGSHTISIDGSVITITETTGTYHAVDNPGGYSGPDELNPSPGDVARFLYLTKKNYSSDDVDINGFIDNSSPVSVSADKTWNINISTESGSGTLDGHYEAWILVLPEWKSGVSYGVGKIVYYSGNIYLSISPILGSAPGSVVGQWEIVPNETTTYLDLVEGASDYGNDDSSNVRIVRSGNYNFGVIKNSEICYANQASENCGGCDDCKDDSEQEERILKIEFFLRCATISFAKNNYVKGEKSVEALKNLCDENDCVSC